MRGSATTQPRAAAHPLGMLLKVVLFLFLYIWLRGTFPRLRYDMLMRLGWKVLLPLAIANVIVTGIVLVAVQG